MQDPDSEGNRSRPREARALWLVAPGRAELRSEPLSALGPGEALVRTQFSAFSRGTERLVFEGRVPRSEYQRMRAPFQVGEFPFPVKYGYCNVGRVLEGPAELRDRSVFCLYPHQTLYQVPASALSLVPEHVPPARAVLAANMETALNAIWDAALAAGDRVCVVGAGVVGCLVAYLAVRHPGCEVHVLDVDPRKAEVARALGAHFAGPDAPPRECDVVLHASGAPEGLTSALEAAGLEARIVELSWYGATQVSVPLGEAFHARRLSIVSSQVGRLPAKHAPRWSHARRRALALALLGDPVLDLLISGESRFDQAPEALAALSVSPRPELCRRLVYDP
jgi:NADPH:quinone reductase-like Zn-dependent oxidoreductase